MQIAQQTFEPPQPDPSILVVDDLPQNQLAMEATLEPLSVRIVRANSGEEALKLLLDEEFALIFLDVQMPGMDGLETASLIKKRAKTAHVPIIFLTAIHSEDEYMFRGYGEGAVDYVVKPVDPEILRVKAAVFLDLYRRSVAQQKASRKSALTEAREAFTEAAGELRIPLNAARIQAQLASERYGKSDRRAGELLYAITGQIDRLSHMVDELFDLTKLRAGKIALVPSRFDLVTLASEIVERMRHHTSSHRLFVSGERVVTVQADRQRMEEVITNLVSNAIRYAPMGGEVEVSVSHRDGKVLLSVRDEGLGMFREQLDKLFLHPENEDALIGGGGLGLTIVQGLVASHGGKIWAESAGIPGKGSTFFVELPSELPLAS